eukprot:4996601-Amphidinium_carterae.2
MIGHSREERAHELSSASGIRGTLRERYTNSGGIRASESGSVLQVDCCCGMEASSDASASIWSLQDTPRLWERTLLVEAPAIASAGILVQKGCNR